MGGGGGDEVVMGSAISIPQCYLTLSPLWGRACICVLDRRGV